jgi:hypothetical protein
MDQLSAAWRRSFVSLIVRILTVVSVVTVEPSSVDLHFRTLAAQQPTTGSSAAKDKAAAQKAATEKAAADKAAADKVAVQKAATEKAAADKAATDKLDNME